MPRSVTEGSRGRRAALGPRERERGACGRSSAADTNAHANANAIANLNVNANVNAKVNANEASWLAMDALKPVDTAEGVHEHAGSDLRLWPEAGLPNRSAAATGGGAPGSAPPPGKGLARPVVPFGPYQGAELTFHYTVRDHSGWQFVEDGGRGRGRAWGVTREQRDLAALARGDPAREVQLQEFNAAKKMYMRAYLEGLRAWAGVASSAAPAGLIWRDPPGADARSDAPGSALAGAMPRALPGAVARPVVPFGPLAGCVLGYSVAEADGAGDWWYEGSSGRRRPWRAHVEHVELEGLALGVADTGFGVRKRWRGNPKVAQLAAFEAARAAYAKFYLAGLAGPHPSGGTGSYLDDSAVIGDDASQSPLPSRASWARYPRGEGKAILVPVRVLTPPPEVPFGPHAGCCLGLEIKEAGSFSWMFTPRGKRRRMWKEAREEAELEALSNGDPELTGQLAVFRSRKDMYLSACGGGKAGSNKPGAGSAGNPACSVQAKDDEGAAPVGFTRGRRRRMRFHVPVPRPVVPFGPHQGTELRFAVKRNGSQYWQFRNNRDGGKQQAWANGREESELEQLVRGCCDGYFDEASGHRGVIPSEACVDMRAMLSAFQASKQAYAQAYYEAARAEGVDLNVVKYRRRSVYPFIDLERAPRPVVPFGPHAGVELSYTIGTKGGFAMGSGAWSYCAEAQGRRRRHWGLKIEQAELEKLAYDPSLTHFESKERAAQLAEFQRAQSVHVQAYMDAHAQVCAPEEAV